MTVMSASRGSADCGASRCRSPSRPRAPFDLWGSISRPELMTCGDRYPPVDGHDHRRVVALHLPDLQSAARYADALMLLGRGSSSNPRSAAERRSWTRRSPSPQVTDLHPPRNSANPWTHVRTVFEPTTSRDADEARTRPQRPAITTAVSPTYPQPADLQQRHHDPQFRVIDHGQAVSIPSGTPRLA